MFAIYPFLHFHKDLYRSPSQVYCIIYPVQEKLYGQQRTLYSPMAYGERKQAEYS